MRSYRELADRVFERRDNYLVARKRKRKRIIKRVSATSCALFVALGAGVLLRHIVNQDTVPSDNSTVYSQTNPHHDASNNSNPFIEVPTTPAPTIPDITPPTTTKQDTSETTTKKPTTTTEAEEYWFNYYKNSDFRYYSGSSVLDYIVEGDLVHVLTAHNYYVLDTNAGKSLGEISFGNTLSATKMRLIDGELWIALRNGRIVVYDKQTLELEREIKVADSMDNFDVGGKYIFYTPNSIGDRVSIYRYNMETKETVVIPDWLDKERDGTFFKPDILVDEQSGFVYVGQQSDTLSYYNMETLSIRGRFVVGTENIRQRIYKYGDIVYWGRCRINVVTREYGPWYSSERSTGMLYADNKYVINTVGVFDSATGECLLNIDLVGGYNFYPLAAVTSSGHLVIFDNTSSTFSTGVVYVFKNKL